MAILKTVKVTLKDAPERGAVVINEVDFNETVHAYVRVPLNRPVVDEVDDDDLLDDSDVSDDDAVNGGEVPDDEDGPDGSDEETDSEEEEEASDE